MNKLAESLSPSERKVVPHLKDGRTISEISEHAKVQEVEAMRACQFLENKGVLKLDSKLVEGFSRTKKGDEVVSKGLPEQRFLDSLSKPMGLGEIQKHAKLEKDELNASIGILKKAGAIQLGQKVSKLKDVDFSDTLNQLQKLEKIDEQLVTRGLVEKVKKTVHSVKLTEKGKKLQSVKLDDNFAEKLTPQMLRTGSWKDKKFRRYDVASPLPAKHAGRKHFVNEAISYIKQLWIEMGFEEMKGKMTQTAFWDLDALFVPQDHPAREMQDTFYLKGKGKLPSWWKEVKKVHEDGGDTGSEGWQYEYSEEEASKVLLRTHTTVLSAQMLKEMGERKQYSGKYFSVNKVFRNETLDWKHLFEFHQVEGIVVGEDLTLGDLIGLQTEFYKKMGYTKVRFRPGYFPYTEPSAEVEAFHPGKKQWVELGGMGVFRPELVKTLLGKDVPVLAWGLGMERIITLYYEIKDLRHIYDNDLERMKTMKKFIAEDH